MSPKWKRWLLGAVVLLLACGLLFSGAAHVALHDHCHEHELGVDPAGSEQCPACSLASPVAPIPELTRTWSYTVVERLEDPASEVWKSRRELAASARGPPRS
ncbi:MAG: hypothetical protein FJ299_07565 [Planctomycetes bacterium]|nr:hypothetical protein [Planctomycetota bacterium]